MAWRAVERSAMREPWITGSVQLLAEGASHRQARREFGPHGRHVMRQEVIRVDAPEVERDHIDQAFRFDQLQGGQAFFRRRGLGVTVAHLGAQADDEIVAHRLAHRCQHLQGKAQPVFQATRRTCRCAGW